MSLVGPGHGVHGQFAPELVGPQGYSSLTGLGLSPVSTGKRWASGTPRGPVPVRGMGMATEASTPRRKLSAILMVDVSGFSRMMGRDEEGTTALIREFHTRTRALVEAHEGWVVDTAGDSVFGEFDSVVNAVRC